MLIVALTWLSLAAVTRCTSLFYIYEWPASVVDSWPSDFTFTKRLSFERQFEANHGVGRRVGDEQGVYHTHQYSLFRTFLARLRESTYRTLDPTQASLFFVPYDVGMDSTTRTSDGAMAQTHCPRGHEANTLLANSTYFLRKKGRDHVVLHSINQMMMFYVEASCRRFYQLCYNCIKLSIDTYSEKQYRELLSVGEMSHMWVSIPFPSNYHYHGEEGEVGVANTKKWYHLAYVGSDWITAKKQRELRIALRQECYRRSNPFSMSRPDIPKGSYTRRGEGDDAQSDCLFTDMASHNSMTVGMFHFIPPSRQAWGLVPSKVRNPYALSTLCLMPGGDFPSRKGVLDAMLTGCVPVFFQQSTAITQWPWHWGTIDTARSCTILVSREDFLRDMKGGFDYLISLAKNQSFVQDKLKCIDRVASRMQYNLPGAGPSSIVDAVDVILARLLFQSEKR